MLIYEIDERTIGIAADTDQNGTYETTIAESIQVTLGDVNEDEEVTVDDAQIALQAYTNLLAGKDSGLNPAQEKAADVNIDGAVTVEDAQAILQYYTNVLAKKDPTWEEILHPEGE